MQSAPPSPEARSSGVAKHHAVRYKASLALDANVQFLTVMAAKLPFIGRG